VFGYTTAIALRDEIIFCAEVLVKVFTVRMPARYCPGAGKDKGGMAKEDKQADCPDLQPAATLVDTGIFH
jgi:hypothetical protein